jgi:hypothetical protein
MAKWCLRWAHQFWSNKKTSNGEEQGKEVS